MLSRKVEVYCWREELSHFEERRGNQVRKGTKCDYKPHWCNVSSMPDSSKFRDRAKVNIKSSVNNEEFRAHGVRLGAFGIAIDQVEKTFGRTKYSNLYRHGEFRAPQDPQGTWQYHAASGEIRRSSRPGTDQIGDIRVRYECLAGFGPVQGPQVSALGTQSQGFQNERHLVQCSKKVKCVLNAGHISAE